MLLRKIDDVLGSLVAAAIWVAIAINNLRCWIPGMARRLRGDVRWLIHDHAPLPAVRRGGRPAWNRTPPTIEKAIRALKATHDHLGNGMLARLVERLHRVQIHRETVRRVLARKPVVAPLKQKPRSINVCRPRRLWGTDRTLVWLFGFYPVWLLGVIDYHGSRLMCLKRLAAPTTAEVQRVLARVFGEFGAPARMMTDRGAIFRALSVELFLAEHAVEHTLTKPRHPQTNGRIERLFRTFKETVFQWLWLFSSGRQIDRFCAEFTTFYNRDRPHSRFKGKTPDEVYFGRPKPLFSRGTVQYFDGRFLWHKFG